MYENISLGVLSWKAHNTLEKTLDSYTKVVGGGESF